MERWLDQLEDSMIQSLCDINSKAVRSYSTTSLETWIFQWPAMVSYCALYINWTTEIENAMKNDELNVRIYKRSYILVQCNRRGCGVVSFQGGSSIATGFWFFQNYTNYDVSRQLHNNLVKTSVFFPTQVTFKQTDLFRFTIFQKKNW